MQATGGIPRYVRKSFTTDGEFHSFAQGLSMHLWVRPETSSIRIFASEADWAANDNYVTVTSTDPAYSVPLEDRGVWIRGVGGTVVAQIAVFHRKG